ncbi:hypothetical protein BH24ACT5_BH24ACT5_30140 [soil metagenome]|jgi:hypothetical protein
MPTDPATPTAWATLTTPSASDAPVAVDPVHEVTLALVSRTGLGTDWCATDSEVSMAPPFPDLLAALDQEVATFGMDRWSSERPTWWIGNEASVERAYGAVEKIAAPPHVWVIVAVDDSWLAQRLRAIHTPAGNTVWAPVGTVTVHSCDT